ncbi:MAG: hypothetical protein WDA00_03720 [Eubacteriales bacterium]
MKEYLAALILTAALAALASLFSAEGKTRKYVNFTLSLVAFLVIVSPLSALRADWQPDLPPPLPPAGDSDNPVVRLAEAELARAIEKAFLFERGSVSVDMTTTGEGSGLRVEEIEVHCPEGARTAEVRAYVRRAVEGDCEVRVYAG